ncbi:hypothetical protein SVAN01_08436 [Stagonosporopsis vannaccii]|nr:hypothetical protein SVAN01_08436 [Stagonosporopsis vannaccii]
MWEALRSLTLKEEDHSAQEGKGDDDSTSEREPEERPTTEGREPRSKTCHFLRLPTEIRLQIYAYTDIGGHTIEVLNLPIIQTSKGVQCFRTYSTNPIDHELVYRLECPDDEHSVKPSPAEAPLKPLRSRGYLSGSITCGMPRPRAGTSYCSAEPAKRRRCFSVHGLFALTSVCQQIRTDTQVLVYELNAFTFTDGNYNYSSAIRAFTSSLTQREIAAIHTLYWPLVNVLVYRQGLHGVKLEEPDRSCTEELGALKGLDMVFLRHFGPGFDSVAIKYSDAEAQELKEILAGHGAHAYAVEREYQRTLAVKTMNVLLARKHVEVHCERSWRANF